MQLRPSCSWCSSCNWDLHAIRGLNAIKVLHATGSLCELKAIVQFKALGCKDFVLIGFKIGLEFKTLLNLDKYLFF